jgi:hypothetical protein
VPPLEEQKPLEERLLEEQQQVAVAASLFQLTLGGHCQTLGAR